MVYQTGNLCSGGSSSNNVSTAWTMIAAENALGWAQSGELFYPSISGGCWRHFAQQEQSKFQTPVTKLGSCVSAGQLHRAWQQTVSVGGSQVWAVRSNIDTTIFLQSNFNPFANWNLPFIPEFEGETHYDSGSGWSDVPGTAANPVSFANAHGFMQVQDDNGTWYDTCGNVNLYANAAQHYSSTALECDFVQVWTSQL